MAKVFFEGFREIDFVGNDGKRLKGIKLFFAYPSDGVIGFMTDSQFLSDSLCQQTGITASTLVPFVSEEVNLETNLKGKIVGISLVKKDGSEYSPNDSEISDEVV